MQVKAAVRPGVRQPFSVEQVQLDPPRYGEVLVKLVATGVCHSDVHEYTGDNAHRPFPIIFGHEGAGASRIAELPIPPRTLTNYRKKVQGVLFGDAQFRWHAPRYVRRYEEGRIDPDGLVTREPQLEDINATVENILAENRASPQVIRFD